jgi:hypothetical protein
METTHEVSAPRAHRSGAAVVAAELTLDELAARSFSELDALYRTSPCPTSVRALDGAPKGRMLAIRLIERTPVMTWVRAWAASPSFAWDGKSFTSASDGYGRGINRVQIPGLLGRQELFPFATRFGSSAIDGQPAVVLDYDLPENPPYIRKVHDEVREVSPGLFLGPAMWKAAAGPAMVLWFALDRR